MLATILAEEAIALAGVTGKEAPNRTSEKKHKKNETEMRKPEPKNEVPETSDSENEAETIHQVTGMTWEPVDHSEFHHVPDYFVDESKMKATWGKAKEDGLGNKAWMWRQCPTDIDRLSKCTESDVGLHFITLKHGSYCRSGWQFKGMSKTTMECARECYAAFGCLRFSVDHEGECRISVGVVDSPLQKEPLADLQCEHATSHDEVDVKLYQLVFYHATHAGAHCSHFYKLVEGINTTAQCAHACKNHETCRSFSVGSGRVDGGCVYGCRISDCHANTEGSTGSACRSQNSKCELEDVDKTRKQWGSCYHYELDKPKSIPAP